MVRDVIESFLYPETLSYHNFMLWAFGEDYKCLNFNTDDPVLAWNKLHKNYVSLSSTGNPEENLNKMITLWKKHENQPIGSP